MSLIPRQTSQKQQWYNILSTMDALKDNVSSLLDLFSMKFQLKMYIKAVYLIS